MTAQFLEVGHRNDGNLRDGSVRAFCPADQATILLGICDRKGLQ